MEKEKVIFRREYNPYTKEHGFLAVFPETVDRLRRVTVLPFCFRKDFTGKEYPVFECHNDADIDYLYKRKIVHKNDKIIPVLLSAIEKFYGQQFCVAERIMH